MFLIKLFITIVAIAAAVFVNFPQVTTVIHKYGTEEEKTEHKFVPNIVGTIGVFAAFFIAMTLSSGFGIVQAGNVGVVTRLGGVEAGRILHEGPYVVIPGIEEVHQVDTKPHLIALENDDAVTLDRQAVKTTVKLLLQVDPAIADQTYREYRDNIVDTAVAPKFQEAVKTVTARYDAKTQVTNRGVVQAEMLAYVQHELQGKGVIIPPGALSITNFEYASDYQQAIEETQVAQQNLVKAQAELKVNQIEAEQKVAAARGEAESQALLARTITPTSLQYEFYKHWDGHLPEVISSGQNIMDISSLMKSK